MMHSIFSPEMPHSFRIASINTRAKQDVDILFVVDTSSMSPKQKQLGTAIDSFIKKIDMSGSNYHVGVVSTDIGAQQAPNTAFQPGSLNIPGCVIPTRQ